MSDLVLCRAECGSANGGCGCAQCWKHKGMGQDSWLSTISLIEFLAHLLTLSIILNSLSLSFYFIRLWKKLHLSRHSISKLQLSTSSRTVSQQPLIIYPFHIYLCMYVCIHVCMYVCVCMGNTFNKAYNLLLLFTPPTSWWSTGSTYWYASQIGRGLVQCMANDVHVCVWEHCPFLLFTGAWSSHVA